MIKKYPAFVLVLAIPLFALAQRPIVDEPILPTEPARPPVTVDRPFTPLEEISVDEPIDITAPSYRPLMERPQEDRSRLTPPIFTVPAQAPQPSVQLPPGVASINSLVQMKPTDPKLVAWRNSFYDKIKELEDARKLYVESGAPLPDGFFTMHTARDGWRINFLRTAANLYVSRQPRVASPVLSQSPAQAFLQQIQAGPASTPIAPVPSTDGLGGPVGGGGSVTSGGGFVGSVNDWIAQSPIGKANLSIYGEISLVKTYSSDIMIPYWVDGVAGFVFNFNALQNPQTTANGQRAGTIPLGIPGSDLVMTFETKNQGPLNTPYTYVLFYRFVRIGDEIIKQKITYEQFMEYGEKRGYWEQGWSPLAGKRWELNPNDAWKDTK